MLSRPQVQQLVGRGSGGNINIRGIAARLGDSVALFFEPLDVELDRLLDIALDFLLGSSSRATAG